MFKTPVVLVLCSILPLTTAQEANITVPPRPVNISIGEVAEFNCTAIANNLYWEWNGRQLHKSDKDVSISQQVLNKQKNIRESTLKINVTSDIRVNITCVAYMDETLSEASRIVLMLVQGLLKPVHNLNVTVLNLTTVLISWSPPFTLEGVPILSYNVTISNTTSGENETMSIEGNTTMLVYHPNPDSNFTVTVICINKAGPGQEVSMTFFMPLDPVISSTLQVMISTPASSTQSSTLSISSTITASLNASPAPSTGIFIGSVVSVFIIAIIIGVPVIMCVIVKIYRRKHNRKADAEGPNVTTVTEVFNESHINESDLLEKDSSPKYHSLGQQASEPEYDPSVKEFSSLPLQETTTRKRKVQ